MNQWEMVAAVRVVFFLTGGKERCMRRRKNFYYLLPLFLQQLFSTYLPLMLHFPILLKQYLEPPIPTGSPNTLAAVLPSLHRVPVFCT